MRVFSILSVLMLSLAFGTSAVEGPRAFFGFVTHYETSASGRGEVLVQRVVPASPAERAGLQPGDLIVAFNGVGFTFSDEYQYMRSIGVFESGKKLTLTVHRSGRELKMELVPESLAPQQVEAIAGYMQKLEGCMKTGEDCPCPLGHGPSVADDTGDFRSAYRRFTDAISQQGGRTVLEVERDSEGHLHFSSVPVALPLGFEITADDDGILWQKIQALGKGKLLQVEISSTTPDSRRVRILSP